MHNNQQVKRKLLLLWFLLTAGLPLTSFAQATGHSSIDTNKARILLVTGIDYPGHLWQRTTPVLTEALRKEVSTYARGRTFHCTLGHDVKALNVQAVQELYRRGCAWAAGLSPALSTSTAR